MIPHAHLMCVDDIKIMLDAVKNNDQIYDAAETSNILEQVFDLNLMNIGDTKSYWREFIDAMTHKNGGNKTIHYSYPNLRAKLDQYI
ncbi:hypothetical protein [Photorhabdus laumondii]|uniref:Uncharacterized protein n=1 Tax=Photorhabdus laumondii subsp. clarkei TaxID=2029685 RepID=A0A329V935_9GAMM|nr:hypothetical protein [Photorhabdus laumondii]PQQ39457.1 hypothetical protein C6H68_02840 [Photorhabdus luminescens]RAW81806.1 hypothetical protein CKY01_22600 [Photorhabdus laumondii subsp. clarkei]